MREPFEIIECQRGMHLQGHVSNLVSKISGGTEHQPLTAISHADKLSVDQVNAITPWLVPWTSPQGLRFQRMSYFWFHSKP